MMQKMQSLVSQVDTLNKKVGDLEKQNKELRPIVADFSQLDKAVINSIQKKAPELFTEIVKKELADFMKQVKLSVQEMKNEQVNQIKSGVV